MNNFDKIYIINLEHRKDRLQHIYSELKKLNVDFNKVERINAVYFKEFGAIGCAMSHRIAIKKFLSNKSLNNCLILEDDWQIKEYISTINSNTKPKIKNLSEKIINAKINNFFNTFKNNWDVILLSGNFGVPDDIYINGSFYKTNVLTDKFNQCKDVYKVVNVQTTSGYGISRNIADKLDNIYELSINNMKNGLKLNMDPKEIKTNWAMDILWKNLQQNTNYKWFIFVPTLGKQLDGFSDIEQQNVNYNC
jgi:GR25 family glycosyltransferase involved in LPS biosynthesis